MPPTRIDINFNYAGWLAGWLDQVALSTVLLLTTPPLDSIDHTILLIEYNTIIQPTGL